MKKNCLTQKTVDMSCFSCQQRLLDEGSISLVCSVSDAPSVAAGGEVRVDIRDARPPVQIAWLQDEAAALLKLSPDRCTAYCVPPGVYNVVVTDSLEREAQCVVTVRLITLTAVVGYDVTHATGDSARDGHLRVITRGASPQQRFLWSSGVITSTPELHDVRPGIYVAVPIGDDGAARAAFLHECAPAVIHPSRELDARVFL